jgi:putative transposase
VSTVLPLAAQQYPSLKKVWVDSGYAGPQVQAIAEERGGDVEVVKRSDQAKGFVLEFVSELGPSPASA